MPFFFLLLCCAIKAQLQFNSFQDLLRYADVHAASIQTALINEKVSLASQKEATYDLLPSVNASFGYNDNITLQPTLVPAQIFNPAATEGEFEELTFGTKFLYSRDLTVQWDLLNFQKIFAYQTARLEVESSKVNTELNRYNIYNTLATTYYSILLTQEAIQIFEKNLSTSSSILALAEEKYGKGVISEADLNLAKIKKLQNQSSLRLTQNNLQQYYIQLQSQLNTNNEIVISDHFDNFFLDNTRITSIHPEVLFQEIELKKSKARLKQNKAQLYPSLSLVYQNGQSWATNGFMDFSSANQLPQQYFGVQLNFSGLFSMSSRQKIKQAERQVDMQQLQFNNTILVKQKDDELLQLQYQQAADKLFEYKEILALQEQNDVHADNQLQGGIMSLDERLNKYDDLLAVQNSYLESLASYTIAQYKIFTRQINYQPK